MRLSARQKCPNRLVNGYASSQPCAALSFFLWKWDFPPQKSSHPHRTRCWRKFRRVSPLELCEGFSTVWSCAQMRLSVRQKCPNRLVNGDSSSQPCAALSFFALEMGFSAAKSRLTLIAHAAGEISGGFFPPPRALRRFFDSLEPRANAA